MMTIKTSALQNLSNQVQSLERKIEAIVLAWTTFDYNNGKKLEQLKAVELQRDQNKMALIRCRDVIENIWREIPYEDFELRQEVAIFLNGLSLTIGDGPTGKVMTTDEVLPWLAKLQENTRKKAEEEAAKVAKEQNALKRKTTRKKKL